MQALMIPGFPLELVHKRLTFKDFNRIPKNVRPVSLPNYYALLAYAFCQRVMSDKELQQMLKENTVPLTSYTVNKNKKFFNKTITVTEMNYSLGKYVGIIRYVEKLIKEDKFKTKEINKFIESVKDAPDKDLLDGVAVNITVTPNETVAKKPSKKATSEVTPNPITNVSVDEVPTLEINETTEDVK